MPNRNVAEIVQGSLGDQGSGGRAVRRRASRAASGGPPRVLVDTARPATALASAAGGLVSASGDGIVRVWDVGSATVVGRGPTGPGLPLLALAPGGRVVASAGLDRTIRLHDAATGAVLEALPWHEAAVWGLAWAGPVLVSGDGRGRVALWDVGDRVP